MQRQEAYPVRFTVDYPDRPLDRLTTAFRIVVAIPIMIVLGAVSGGESWQWSNDTTQTAVVGAGGLLFLGPLLMILFRQKYPRWWFDWNLELQRFGNRVVAYLALMDDRYPATDEHQSVHLDYPYPDAQRDLNRWLPLVKWLLAIPHYIVLFFLDIAALVVVIVAWFAILFTGLYPPSASPSRTAPGSFTPGRHGAGSQAGSSRGARLRSPTTGRRRTGRRTNTAAPSAAPALPASMS